MRFAGPRLAGGDDDLVPVKLRRGGRILGGSLSWEQPQPLAAFSRESPFFGMVVPNDVSVSRQVHQIRTRNINAPFPGTPLDPTLTLDQINLLRPFYPNVARLNKYESVGNALSKTVNFLVQIPATKKILKTQISGTFQYGLTWAEDDNSAQNPYNVRADWASNDQRHRFTGTFSIRPPNAGSLSLNAQATSGRTYSITTGKDNGKRANLMFGPEPGNGGSFIVARTAPTDAKPSKAVVDHVCYTIANWDDQKVRAALKAKGLEVGGRDGSLHVFDPFGYYVQIASAEAENAFRR